tara:strand:+ start:31 stop:339 length:309 start_codon:yes stop_codon:yes gene_type:complete
MDKDSHLIFENYKDLSSFDITKHVKDVGYGNDPSMNDIVWLKTSPKKLNIDKGEKVEYGIPLGNPKTLRQGVVVTIEEDEMIINVRILDIHMLPRFEGQGRQ